MKNNAYTLEIRLLLMLVLTLSARLAVSGERLLLLAANGKTEYRILVAAVATPDERYAAGLLQKYLLKISGVSFPVIKDTAKPVGKEIIVGFSNRTSGVQYQEIRSSLSPDGFHILTQGKRLIILGGADKGAIYGVVDLLERSFGCRKYSPSVESVPVNKTLEIIPVNYSGQPVATFRIVHGQFSKDPDYKAWSRLDEVEDVFAQGYYVHTFGKLLPWEKYFSTNPEYFAFMNGKRIIDQPCLSNPDVLEISIEHLRTAMAAQPEKKLWSVSQNDNFSYCQCNECRKVIEEEGAPSGPVIRFVNKIAETFPDKTISTLAYQFSRQAPKVTKPRENVQIMLCTIELNRAMSIETDPSSRLFLRDIEEWGKISRNIYLWDYTVNFSNSISPFPNLHTLQPNIRFFIRNGAFDHFQQTNTDAGHEFSELKSYLIARLLWNPDANADSIINDFLEGYYGKAGQFIREYIDLLQKEYEGSGQWLDIYGSPVWNANAALSAENMAVYNYLFDKAEKAVTGKMDILRRVKAARLPLQYAAMEIGKNDMFGPRGWYSEMNGKYVIRPKMKAMLESFHAVCKANRVNTLNESGLTPEEYYKSTLRFIDVQVENNKAFRKKISATPLPSIKYSGGDLAVLTNGVQGANDFKVHWLGWEARDFRLELDLESTVVPKSIRLGTLYDPKSWILHPVSVQCESSADGATWRDLGTIQVTGDQKKEEVNRTFLFDRNIGSLRYLRFNITGTKHLPIWHPSAGGDSWVFVDEIIVE